MSGSDQRKTGPARKDFPVSCQTNQIRQFPGNGAFEGALQCPF